MKILSLAVALTFAVLPVAFAQSSHSMGGHDMGTHMAEAQPGVPGTGTVDAVNAASRQVKLTHAPIKALGWPAMTMDFAVAAGLDISKLKAG
ncbi:MAG: copper-binding protein, partial [Magnetospirillum sp.]